MNKVILHRLAERELARIAKTLGKESPSKRKRFYEEFFDAIDSVIDNPEAGSPIHGNYRWVRTKKFRYILYYGKISTNEYVVYAISHSNRRPGYWLSRTRRP